MSHRPRFRRRAAAALAAGLLVAALPGAAVAPAIALMVKQMLQQSVTSMVKDTLLGSLRDTGCKGIALANAISALDARGGGMAAFPPAMAGMPLQLPGVGIAGALPAAGAGAAMPAGAAAPLEPIMQMPALPPGVTLEPGQLAMISQMQAMLRQPPASPAETVATIDEMAAIGLLPAPVQGELKECMTVLPQAVPAMGMAIGMLRPMLPQLRQAREQLHALSADEQDELGATIAQELQSVPNDERRTMLESIGSGFFPPRVVEGVRSRLGLR